MQPKHPTGVVVESTSRQRVAELSTGQPEESETAHQALWMWWLRLASTQLHGTVHWAEEERLHLRGSHALERSEQFPMQLAAQDEALLAPLRTHAPLFFDGTFSHSAFAAAAHIVQAHSVVASESKVPLLLPLPLLPLLYQGDVALHVSPSHGGLQLVALKHIPAGAAISIDSGSFGHADILLRQGTPGVGPQAAVDASVHGAGPGLLPLRVRMDEASPLHDLKQVLLMKHSLSPDEETFELRDGQPPPASLMAYLRLLVLQAPAYRPQPTAHSPTPTLSSLGAVNHPHAVPSHDPSPRFSGARAASPPCRRAPSLSPMCFQRRQCLPPHRSRF